VRGYSPNGRGIVVRFSVGTRYFSHSIHIGFRAHAVFYPMGTLALIPRIKRPGGEADHSPPSRPENSQSQTSTPTRVQRMLLYKLNAGIIVLSQADGDTVFCVNLVLNCVTVSVLSFPYHVHLHTSPKIVSLVCWCEKLCAVAPSLPRRGSRYSVSQLHRALQGEPMLTGSGRQTNLPRVKLALYLNITPWRS
jgi:hypothetical protein